jgi:hypothetical protein
MPIIPIGPPPTLETPPPTAYDFVIAELEPYLWMDESLGFPLSSYASALCSVLEFMQSLVSDVGDRPGWSVIMDPDGTVDEGLPWLGQFVGVPIPDGTSGTVARQMIKNQLGWKRGTLASIVSAMQDTLTGQKHVVIQERAGSAYHFNVVTYTSETPNSAATEAALVRNKPAGLTYSYNVYAGQSYQQLLAVGTYQTVYTTFTTYEKVATHEP